VIEPGENLAEGVQHEREQTERNNEARLETATQAIAKKYKLKDVDESELHRLAALKMRDMEYKEPPNGSRLEPQPNAETAIAVSAAASHTARRA
jgi:hypothetical protein